MIELVSLSLQNFLSHTNTHLDIPSYRGLVLIEGVTSDGRYSSNGSGKSTILEGIIYALTGGTLRGVGVNDVVNRNVNKDTRVSLKFKKDGSVFEVLRCRKDTEHGDALLLYKDGENLSKRVNRDTQKLVEDILGISYKVLVSTMLLGEGLSSKFTQLSDPDKKSLIESTLNLDVDLNKCRDKANKQISTLNGERSYLSGELSTIKKFAELGDTDLEASIKEKLDRTNLLSSSIHNDNTSIQKLQAEEAQALEKLDVLRTTLSSHDNLVANLASTTDSLTRLANEFRQLDAAEIPHCTLCLQELRTQESVTAVKSDYITRIEKFLASRTDLQDKLSKLPDRTLIESKLTRLSAALSDIQVQKNSLQHSVIESSKEIASLEANVASLNEALSRKAQLEKDSELVQEKLIVTDDSIKKYDYFYKLFSPTGIITSILSDAVGYINERLSVYSSVLLDKFYTIEFVKGKILLVDNRGSSYQSLSNGEKRRLDIAIQFSLHDYVHMYCGLKLDCCFIDEVLDTLDDVGVDNIFDVLRLKLEYCQLTSVYVITHNSSLKDKFDKVITVRKDSSGNSSIK